SPPVDRYIRSLYVPCLSGRHPMAIEAPAKRSESADTCLAHPVSADLSDLATVLLGHNIVDLVPTVTELSPLAEWNIVSRFDSPSSARAAIVRLERHGIDGS